MAQVVRVAAEPHVGHEHMPDKKLKFLFLLVILIIKIISTNPNPILQYKMPLLHIIKTLIFPLVLLLVFVHILFKGLHFIQWQTDQILYMIQTNRANGHYR
jgi:hypothetical protein